MDRMNTEVEVYLSQLSKWQEETIQLRKILLSCPLREEMKWGKPCYTFQKSNVVVLQGFKNYCAMLFLKGCLLDDPEAMLVKTGENTRVGRQIRFTRLEEIIKIKTVLKSYINNAIEVEKSGLKVDVARETKLKLPAEFQTKLDEMPALKTAFEALTPGRQRAYNFHFSSPKQSKTRATRVEKLTRQILAGKGLND